MDTGTREYRAASHLPPVSVCLLLAVASVLLLCSRTETVGEPEGESHQAGQAAQSIDSAASRVSAEELRILTWMHSAEKHHAAGTPELSVTTMRRAAKLAKKTRVRRQLRVEIQQQLARSLDAAGDNDAAVEVWWQLLSMVPQHDEVARGLASSLYASGRIEEARRVYREILYAEFEVASYEPALAASTSGTSSAKNSGSDNSR